MNIKLGTRASRLAQAQTILVRNALERQGHACRMVTVRTRGDGLVDRPIAAIGGKGVFTAELEEALRSGAIDAAVHSLKDLPTDEPADLMIAAVPFREDPRDVLVANRGGGLAQLPSGAMIGTGSARRRSQLLAVRTDLRTQDIRGNVETRIAKVHRGEYDGTVLAAAGVIRLGRPDVITEYLEPEVMVPAPGQGALAVQCVVGSPVLAAVAALDDETVRAEVEAERTVLALLEGGCSAPIGVLGTHDQGVLTLVGRVCDADGNAGVTEVATGPASDAVRLGEQVAGALLAAGAGRWI